MVRDGYIIDGVHSLTVSELTYVKDDDNVKDLYQKL